MSSIVRFLHFLNKSRGIKFNQSRKTLYNYLSHFSDVNTLLDSTVFLHFYGKLCILPWWREKKAEAIETLLKDIRLFAKQHPSSALQAANEEIHQIPYYQEIWIKNISNTARVVNHFLEKTHPGCKTKTLPFSEQRVLSLILKPNNSLQVFTFPNLVFLKQGELIPATPLSSLTYTEDYELKFSHSHILEDFNWQFFHFSPAKTGAITSFESVTPFFQKTNVRDEAAMKNHRKLFSLLKQTEYLFIKSQSDRDYQNLVQALHNHYCNLILKPARAETSLKPESLLSLLKQAKEAVKHHYPKDPLLTLFISNIEFHLKKEESWSLNF